MGLRHGIRANMPANREDRVSVRSRMRKSFGIYRPLTHESATEVYQTLQLVKKSVETYLLGRRGEGNYSPLRIAHKPISDAERAERPKHRRMGVTYVHEHKVKKAIKEGSHLWKGFEAGRLISETEQHVSRHTAATEVPLDGFAWYGVGGRRKLVGFLENGEAVRELVEEATLVENLLETAGGKKIEVLIPDHVTVAQYGFRRDGKPLSVDQRHDIESIVQDHFTQANIGTIALGSLTVNDGEPWGAS